MSHLLYTLALLRVPLVGDINAKTLISYCGGAEGVFKSPKKSLVKIPSIGEAIADNILQFKDFKLAEKEIEFINKENIKTFFYADKDYPDRLKHFPDSPVILFQKGNWNPNEGRMVSIVGTRKATPYGKNFCEDLVQALKPYNVTIISGMAYGIDIAAHKKAVNMDIPTVGVLAHGLNMLYPSSHETTAKKMVDQGGALLTEFWTTTSPERENFPKRNRIVAGLCDALIVVETARKGGSMITALQAFDYNKDVFALPGRTDDLYSQGCNYLIRTNRAALIESVDDLAYNMSWETANQTPAKTKQRALFLDLEPDEEKIVNILKDKDSLSIDTISYHSQFPLSKLAATLLGLEFKGLIRQLPGKQYSLIS